MRVILKEGVIFTPTYECLIILGHVVEAYSIFTKITTVVVTSANDSKHMIGSKHYENNGLDFRVWGLSLSMRWAIVKYLNWTLGPDYQFIDEKDHIHSEYDRK